MRKLKYFYKKNRCLRCKKLVYRKEGCDCK